MSREATVRNDKPFDPRSKMCCCNQNQLEALYTFRGMNAHAPAPMMLAGGQHPSSCPQDAGSRLRNEMCRSTMKVIRSQRRGAASNVDR